MSWIERLTPKNTEELKPGLFIQKSRDGYRQVYPAAWNGEVIWKNFFFGGGWFKPLAFFLIIILLALGYYTTFENCMEFQADPCKFLPNITSYCIGQYQVAGLDLNLSRGGNAKRGDTNPLQSYP